MKDKDLCLYTLATRCDTFVRKLNRLVMYVLCAHTPLAMHMHYWELEAVTWQPLQSFLYIVRYRMGWT